MLDWQNYTARMTVVGPRWRDRIKVAWSVLRGFNRMEYSMHVRVSVTEPDHAVFIDGAQAHLIKEDT